MMRDAAFEDKGRLADSAALSHKADSPNRSASLQRPAHRIRVRDSGLLRAWEASTDP
jgi:hypothetical protein